MGFKRLEKMRPFEWQAWQLASWVIIIDLHWHMLLSKFEVANCDLKFKHIQ